MRILVCSVVVILAGCSPMVPIQQTATGPVRPVLSLESQDVTIHLEHLDNQYGHHVFDLEVVNHSDQTISISPGQISFYASPKKFTPPEEIRGDIRTQSYKESHLTDKMHLALNRYQLGTLVRNKEREKAAVKTLFTLLSVGLVLYDAVQDGKDFSKERFTRKDASRSFGRDLLVMSSQVAADASTISLGKARENTYYLPFEAFSDSVIEPGQSQRGKIFLRSEGNYRYSRIIIPVLDVEYVFDFKKPNAQ